MKNITAVEKRHQFVLTHLRPSTYAIFLTLGLGLLIFYYLLSTYSTFDPSTAATTLSGQKVVESTLDGNPVSFIGANKNSFKVFREQIEKEKKITLWMGASHLHTIVDYRPGDQDASYFANLESKQNKDNNFLLMQSLPNMNFNEALFLALSYLQQGLVPNQIILGIVYDDMDDFHGIRSELTSKISLGDQILNESWGKGIQNIKQLSKVKQPKYAKEQTIKSLNTTEVTWFDKSEKIITDLADSNSEVFAKRNNARSYFLFQYKMFIGTILKEFYNLKMTLSGNQNKYNLFKRIRPVESSMVEWNLEALHSLIAISKYYKIPLILYKVPHPSLADDPNFFKYNRKEFNQFFSRIEKLAEIHKGQDVSYYDLGDIIPFKEWLVPYAVKKSPDFFHFNGNAHKILGHNIYNIIKHRK